MTVIIGQLILQFILILINAFFAATEIAVISLNEKKLRLRADDGDKKAYKMLKIVKEPTRFLSTIQIGVTLAGFLGSAFAADNFSEKLASAVSRTFNISESGAGTLRTVSVVIVTLILSYFTLVFGELVPKRIALKHKEKLAEAVCGTVNGLSVVLKPVIWFLTVSTNGVLRLFGIDPHEKEVPVSEEDIVMMLDVGADEGTLDQKDIEYIKNVFKMNDLTADEVMTPRKSIIAVSSDATDAEIIELIEKEGFSRIPVYADTTDNMIGVLHSKDFLLNTRHPNSKRKDSISKPVFIAGKSRLDDVFKIMQKEHNHLAFVINEYGETAGIVTMEDILEEIVGEIWDESDEEIELFKKIGENKYRVLCSAGIEDFFKFFDIAPESDTEAATLNGWLAEKTGSIPEKNSEYDYGTLSIKVTKADETMAQEAVVTVKSCGSTPETAEEI